MKRLLFIVPLILLLLLLNACGAGTPERTFVAIVETMKRFNTSFPPVPQGVTRMMLVCSDQKTKSQIGAVSVSWQDVNSYLWEAWMVTSLAYELLGRLLTED